MNTTDSQYSHHDSRFYVLVEPIALSVRETTSVQATSVVREESSKPTERMLEYESREHHTRRPAPSLAQAAHLATDVRTIDRANLAQGATHRQPGSGPGASHVSSSRLTELDLPQVSEGVEIELNLANF